MPEEFKNEPKVVEKKTFNPNEFITEEYKKKLEEEKN
jgi:hypothetical protein